MLKSIILISATIAVAYSLNSGDYCNLNSCGGKPHTVCTFKSQGPSPRCNKVISVGLTSGEKKKLLDLHNQLRQKVARGQETRGRPGPQPAATNMQKLEWDDEIAAIAQRWANQCNFSHDKCRNTKQGQSVGQNIAYQGTTGDINSITVEDVAKGWYEEVKDYNANSVTRFKDLVATNGKQVGHYTQFVWAKTNKLGCGAIKYPEGGFNRVFLVCNYGPAGNFLGEPVYQTR